MAILKYRMRPEPWARHRERAKYAWLIPLLAIEWVWTWLVYWLSGWAFLEVLEYLGTLSLLLAVVSYFLESGDRIKQKQPRTGIHEHGRWLSSWGDFHSLLGQIKVFIQ